MSDNFSNKVKSQLILAYAFGLIGMLSSAYVYLDEQRNIKNIYTKINGNINYPKDIIVDSITIPYGNKKDKIQITGSGIVISGDKNETILDGDGLLTRSYNLKKWSRFSLNNIFMNDEENKNKFISNDMGIYLTHNSENKIFISGIGLFENKLGEFLNIFSSIKDKNYNDEQSIYINPMSITLNDENGNGRVSIGSTMLKNNITGSTETTSPSTIVLFDKNGKVLYRLPIY